MANRPLIDGETTTTVSYAVTSLPPRRANAQTLLSLWRGRWAIENSAFWVRDVVFGEDHCRVRTGHGPEIMSHLKNAAINFLRALKTPNIAAALRENAVKVKPLLTKLRLTTF